MIQPAETRARRISSSASSASRLKLSRAPGTRTRSPFLLSIAAANFVGGEIGQILDRLHARFAQRHRHRQGDAFDLEHAVLDAEFSALGVERRVLRLSSQSRARALQFLGGVFAKAFDVRDLVRFDIGDVLHRGEPFGHQQLCDHFIDVEGFLEQGGALGELALTAFGLSWLSVMMSICQPVSWLARRTFCPRRPIARDNCSSGTTTSTRSSSSSITTLVTSAGARRVDQEGRLVRVPLDDVDLLALQFGDDRLHPRAAHTDAGADRDRWSFRWR